MKLNPLNDRVVVTPLDAEEKTLGGVILRSRRPPPWAISISGFLSIRLSEGFIMLVRRPKNSVRSVRMSSGGSNPRKESRNPAFPDGDP